MSAVAIRPADLATRDCAAPGCTYDAAPGSDRCVRHGSTGKLAELADVATDEHGKAITALNDALAHGIRCGEALLVAHALVKDSPQKWNDWLEENVGISARYAYGYMRLAHHRDRLPEEAFHPYIDGAGRRRQPSVSRAVNLAAGLPPVTAPGNQWRLPDATRDEVLRLHAERMTYAEISRRVGINPVTVARMCDPVRDGRARASTNRGRRVANAESRAAAEADRNRRIRAALEQRPDLADTYDRLVAIVDGLASDPGLAKPHRYAKAARNALASILGEPS